MVFSRLRQNLSRSSRNCPEQVAQLRDAFPDEKPEKLDQTIGHARDNYPEAAQSLSVTQSQTITSQTHQHSPRKLQKRDQRHHTSSHVNIGLHVQMHPYHLLPHFPPNGWNSQPAGHAVPQYQPAFAPFPAHPGYTDPPQYYAAPMYIQSQPLTSVLKDLNHAPTTPMPVPPFYQDFQGQAQQQSSPPWTPYQSPLECMDSRAGNAVPLYELPPPDLMDYDMSYIIAVRLLPEWNKEKEDRHWDQVRRERNAALRRRWERTGMYPHSREV